MTSELSLGLGLLLIGCGLIVVLWQQKGQRNGLMERLSAPSSPRLEGTEKNAPNAGMHAGQEATLNQLARIGEELAGTDTERAKLRNQLHMAGYHSHRTTGLFMCVKTLGGLLGVLLVLVCLGQEQALSLAGFAGAALGYFIGSTLPEAFIYWRSSQRGERLARAVPDALDLMVICAEAGLPLGRILAVVARELTLAAPELAQELALTVAELNIANDRSRALQNLSNRTRVREIESMVSTLIQAEAYGTPLSQALRNISDDSRKTLILGLEEKAGKLPAHMSVPLMTLILPPIVVVMGAPAMVRLVRMLTA